MTIDDAGCGLGGLGNPGGLGNSGGSIGAKVFHPQVDSRLVDARDAGDLAAVERGHDDLAVRQDAAHGGFSRQPRPTNGILVAITVRNCTLASSGRLAM